MQQCLLNASSVQLDFAFRLSQLSKHNEPYPSISHIKQQSELQDQFQYLVGTASSRTHCAWTYPFDTEWWLVDHDFTVRGIASQADLREPDPLLRSAMIAQGLSSRCNKIDSKIRCQSWEFGRSRDADHDEIRGKGTLMCAFVELGDPRGSLRLLRRSKAKDRE